MRFAILVVLANLTVAGQLQVIISALINYAMLGLVYARFSNPVQRALTLRFGRSMTLTPWGDAWRLSFRVANLRKHQAGFCLHNPPFELP